MEFYSKTKTFRGRNHHFGYREQPRNVEKIFKKKPKKRSYNNNEIEVLEE